MAGKQRRIPFPLNLMYWADKPLELLHGDLCGPIMPTTLGGNQYFLLLVDDHSRYMLIRLLKMKDVTLDRFKKLKSRTEMEVGHKVKVLRTDRGGEFTSNVFTCYCNKLGLQRHLTASYLPHQNGVVEHRSQTVVAMARTLLKSKNMLGEFWGEAVSIAVYLLNHAAT